MPTVTQKLTATQFFNAMKDETLSIKARGMLGTLQAMEIGEQFTLREMSEHMKAGYQSLLSATAELENKGYLVREPWHDREGKRAGMDYRLQGK